MGLASDTKWLDSKFGFDRGFDDYRLVPWDEDQAVRFTVSWIARHRRDTFFYFLHLFAPHSDKKLLPYEASGVSQRTVAERFGLEDYGCRRRKCASGLLRSINAGDLKPLPGENEVLRFLYARGVETLDRALDRLFTDLDELGLLDRMLVVVTSDHGEAFFEHGRLLHSTVHEEILRVPLLVRWPGGEKAGEVRNDPTSSIDVAPTLLRAAGLPTDRLPGRPLQELPRTGGDQREVFAGTTHKAVVAGPWKAIFSVTGDPPLLYGLDRDPAERHDLSGENPEVLARLRERMIAHIEAARQLAESQEPPDSVSLTPDERRRLEALGYLD
jgi:arylsulfatase A-like enzyme